MNDEKRDALYMEYQNRLRNVEEEKEEYKREKEREIIRRHSPLLIKIMVL